MEEVFERKVQEKQKKLTSTEDDLKKKLQESQDNLDKQKADLDTKLATFEKVGYFLLLGEKLAWDFISNML